MSKYSVMFSVFPRTERVFTKEQIEEAAKVIFYTHPPRECSINSEPQELEIQWSEDYLRGGNIIRVVGDVEEP